MGENSEQPWASPAWLESKGQSDYSESAMNSRQIAFYRQARSDWSVFCHLRAQGPRCWTAIQCLCCRAVGVRLFSFPVCHELHYLQMCTEKLAKAYYQVPRRSTHDAFVTFLGDLQTNTRAVAPLGFIDIAALTRWENSVRRIAQAIENLRPRLPIRMDYPTRNTRGLKQRRLLHQSIIRSRPRYMTISITRPTATSRHF